MSMSIEPDQPQRPGNPEAADSQVSSTDSVSTAAMQAELEHYQQEIKDLQIMLDFAIGQSGAVRETPIVVPDSMIAAVKEAEAHLLLNHLPPRDERTKAEQTFRDLNILVLPVTPQTLRDTDDKFGSRGWYIWYLTGNIYSRATQWSQILWLITLAILLWIVLTETLDRWMLTVSIEEETDQWIQVLAQVNQVLNSLVRFGYGALGACVYLLRSLHFFIYRREFNRDRIPEYLNRILLGMISGGTISLFVAQIVTEDGDVTLSEAALGFLAGYNTDFLFRTLERIVEAILPKVGIETMRRAKPAAVTAPVSLSELLDRLSSATNEEERALLRGLIEKLRERL